MCIHEKQGVIVGTGRDNITLKREDGPHNTSDRIDTDIALGSNGAHKGGAHGYTLRKEDEEGGRGEKEERKREEEDVKRKEAWRKDIFIFCVKWVLT